MKNKLIKLMCLILVLTFALSFMVACGGDEDNGNDVKPVEGTGEDRFKDVNFDGEKITILMSNYQGDGRVGTSVAKYMTGLEDNGTENDNDAILKSVNDRNKYVKGKLGLEVDYKYTNADWDTIAEVIKTQFDANDGVTDAVAVNLIGMFPCMMQGIFKNVNTTDSTNYFDFEDDCWYDATMNSLSLNAGMKSGKMYLLASDYFIDILRCVNIIMVNEDKLATYYNNNVDGFYDIIREGGWTWDMLDSLVYAAYSETPNGQIGKDENDSIGIVYQGEQVGSDSRINAGFAMAITHSADIDYITDVGGQMQYFSNQTALVDLSEKALGLVQNRGSFGAADITKVRTIFANGNALFATNLRIYDLENQVFGSMAKCALPFPKLYETDEYKSYVHDNASIGAIFKNSRRFEEVSAYWQYCSIKSEATRTTYYDKGLGVKYDTSGKGKNNMDMLNILHEKMTIDSFIWDRYITDSNSGQDILALYSMLMTYANGGVAVGTSWASNSGVKIEGLTDLKNTYSALT